MSFVYTKPLKTVYKTSDNLKKFGFTAKKPDMKTIYKPVMGE